MYFAFLKGILGLWYTTKQYEEGVCSLEGTTNLVDTVQFVNSV